MPRKKNDPAPTTESAGQETLIAAAAPTSKRGGARATRPKKEAAAPATGEAAKPARARARKVSPETVAPAEPTVARKTTAATKKPTAAKKSAVSSKAPAKKKSTEVLEVEVAAPEQEAQANTPAKVGASDAPDFLTGIPAPSNRPAPRTPAAMEGELRRTVLAELRTAQGANGELSDEALAAAIARAVASAVAWHLDAPEHARAGDRFTGPGAWRGQAGPRGPRFPREQDDDWSPERDEGPGRDVPFQAPRFGQGPRGNDRWEPREAPRDRDRGPGPGGPRFGGPREGGWQQRPDQRGRPPRDWDGPVRGNFGRGQDEDFDEGPRFNRGGGPRGFDGGPRQGGAPRPGGGPRFGGGGGSRGPRQGGGGGGFGPRRPRGR